MQVNKCYDALCFVISCFDSFLVLCCVVRSVLFDVQFVVGFVVVRFVCLCESCEVERVS